MKTLVTPKKKFGQNFLTNGAVKTKVFREIDGIAGRFEDYSLLEIGPGQGDLTSHIVEFDRKTDILEIDPEAFGVIDEVYRENSKVNVVLCDALEEVANPKSQYFEDKKVLISNLPFNVGSRILVELGVTNPDMPFLVILQKEVAQKMIPKEGNFTIFGGWIRLWWEISYQLTISRGSFTPSPNVDCGCVLGLPAMMPVLVGKDRGKLLEILKKLNSMPNKTLVNNLVKHFMSREEATAFILTHEIDPKTRLSWENYQQILVYVYDFLY
jgi:16S rRNA (adenine1518-N6/adenine1519-N6)-dimethyltransferase